MYSHSEISRQARAPYHLIIMGDNHFHMGDFAIHIALQKKKVWGRVICINRNYQSLNSTHRVQLGSFYVIFYLIGGCVRGKSLDLGGMLWNLATRGITKLAGGRGALLIFFNRLRMIQMCFYDTRHQNYLRGGINYRRFVGRTSTVE